VQALEGGAVSKPASIPIFGDAYLADTTHLTTEEHGAYFLLLLAAWRQDDCGLPNDDRKLARIVGLSTKKWSSVKVTIMEFWTVEGDRIYQQRLRREWIFVRQKSEGNRKSAEARWNKQSTENKQSDAMRSHSECNAPPPPYKEEEPNGSPSSPLPPNDSGQDRRGKARSAKGIRSIGKDMPLPDDWMPDLGPAIRKIVDGWPPGMIEREEFNFRNHAAANGRVAKNWNAAFAMWLSKADERRNGSGYGTRPNHPPRDSRDGFQRAIDRRMEAAHGEPSGEAG
jgi:uncharacterized protein YdaU (DUF1376 family)